MTADQQRRNLKLIAFYIPLGADFVLYLEQSPLHKTCMYKVSLLCEFFREPINSNKVEFIVCVIFIG